MQAISVFSYGKIRCSGRNNKGHVLFHRGGGHKKKYRIIDFHRSVWNLFGLVKSLHYDPNRTALLALVIYTNGLLSYILAPLGVGQGSIIYSGYNASIRPGTCDFLSQIPLMTPIHNIEAFPGTGGVFVRAAGTSAIIVRKSLTHAVIKLRSGEERVFSLQCLATYGRLSNYQHNLKNFQKAGYFRWKGWRPVVRGVAKNPVDHPHGGATSGGRPSVSPWGKLTKGVPTRKKRGFSSVYISRFRSNRLNRTSIQV